MIVKVNDYVSNAFSKEQADIVKKVIKDKIDIGEKVILDFSYIKRFTTLFFNFCTGIFVSELGIEEYNKKISLVNLTPLGQSTYDNSYNNAAKKLIDGNNEQEIINILANPNTIE